jgi:hypothetical protein
MGFYAKSEKLIQKPLVEENFTNSICYGKTGSGKTSGYILPNIENRIKLNHGVLVYDFKGNLHNQVKAIAAKHNKLQKVKEIGKPWGEKINILKSLDSRTLRDFYVNMHGDSREPYWQNASANLFSAIYKIQVNLERLVEYEKKIIMQGYSDISHLFFGVNHKEVSLKSIFQAIKSVESLEEFFTTLSIEEGFARANIKSYLMQDGDEKTALQMAYHLEKMQDALESIESFKKLNSSSGDNVAGHYGVLDVANSTLNNAGINEYINNNSFNLQRSLRKGEIVVVDMSNLDESIMGLFNLSIYRALQKNLHQDSNRPVSVFIDEAQKVLHPDYLPDVDICRESKFEYILATQDRLLLDQTLGEAKTEALLRNIVEQYSFATNDPKNSTDSLQKFEYKNLITFKNRYCEPVFFDKNELFEVEFLYQNYIGKERYIDFEEIAEKNIQEDFILLHTPQLYERNETYIKTQKGKIHTIGLAATDKMILKPFLVEVEKQKKQEDDGFFDLCDEDEKAVHTPAKTKEVQSDNDVARQKHEEMLRKIEALYRKTTEDIKSVDERLETYLQSIKTFEHKMDVVDAMVNEMYRYQIDCSQTNVQSNQQNSKQEYMDYKKRFPSTEETKSLLNFEQKYIWFEREFTNCYNHVQNQKKEMSKLEISLNTIMQQLDEAQSFINDKYDRFIMQKVEFDYDEKPL